MKNKKSLCGIIIMAVLLIVTGCQGANSDEGTKTKMTPKEICTKAAEEMKKIESVEISEDSEIVKEFEGKKSMDFRSNVQTVFSSKPFGIKRTITRLRDNWPSHQSVSFQNELAVYTFDEKSKEWKKIPGSQWKDTQDYGRITDAELTQRGSIMSRIERFLQNIDQVTSVQKGNTIELSMTKNPLEADPKYLDQMTMPTTLGRKIVAESVEAKEVLVLDSTTFRILKSSDEEKILGSEVKDEEGDKTDRKALSWRRKIEAAFDKYDSVTKEDIKVPDEILQKVKGKK